MELIVRNIIVRSWIGADNISNSLYANLSSMKYMYGYIWTVHGCGPWEITDKIPRYFAHFPHMLMCLAALWPASGVTVACDLQPIKRSTIKEEPICGYMRMFGKHVCLGKTEMGQEL